MPKDKKQKINFFDWGLYKDSKTFLFLFYFKE